MARRQICALLLVAAASADVNETAASESRVRALAGQSYDWLADRAPAAKAFAAQAAAQHGPGFIGGALAAVLCMLLGGKKQTKSGARRAKRRSRGRRRRHVEASQRRRRCIRLCSMAFFAQVDGEE